MFIEEIDCLVYDFIMFYGVILVFLNYEGFFKSVCISINDVVCYGIFSLIEILKSGDIINVDVFIIYNGYFFDVLCMFMIGEVSFEKQRLVQVIKECMEIGIVVVQFWVCLGDVGVVIQEYVEKNGYSVVCDLCGYGVGIKFYEEFDVEYFGCCGIGMLIFLGMIFIIELMINMGMYEVFVDFVDDWIVCIDDGLLFV